MALDAESLDLPRPFGPYTLLRRLAVGGMAEVYVAKAKGIGGFEKLVAIKVIHPRFSEDSHFVQMLVEEAKISVVLNHVNVAQTFDLGCIDDTYFIVMEYIEGADAYRVMKRAGERGMPLPFDACAFIAAEVCTGLDYAHRKRDAEGRPLDIIHRDVSPQNVLVSWSGEVKLVDFGIAKAASRSGQTEAGVIKGKYYYMSPEQAWGDAIDHRSDIFSTGVVLYELLTGGMLYRDDNLPRLLDRVRKAEIPLPSSRRPDIPTALERIVIKALARRPEDRFQSAHELGQALSQFVFQASPSFSSARIGDLMATLFGDQVRRHTGTVRLPQPSRGTPSPDAAAAELAPMRPVEFAPDPTKSVIFDLGDDDDQDDATRRDVAPYKRKSQPKAPARPSVPPPKPAAAAKAAAGAAQARSARAPQRSHAAPDRRDEKIDPGTEPIRAPKGDDTSATRPLRAMRMEMEEPTLVHPSASAPEAWPSDGATLVDDGTSPIAAPSADGWDDATVVEESQEMAARAHALSGPSPRRAAAPAERPAAAPERKPPHDPRMSDPTPIWTGRPELPARPPRAPSSDWPAGPSVPESWPPTAQHGAAPPPAVPRAAPVPVPSWPPVAPERPPTPVASSFASLPTAPLPAAIAPPTAADPFALSPGQPSTAGYAAMMQTPRRRTWLWAVLALAVIALAGALIAAAVRPAPPDPTLEVVSVPPGARVSLDGTAQPGATPMRIETGLATGRTYRVEVSLPGYEPWTSTFQPTEGRVKQIAVLMPERGRLRIETTPSGAHVWIDGVLHGTTPIDVPGIQPGRDVQLRASKPGFADAVQTFRMPADTLSPRVELTLAPR